MSHFGVCPECKTGNDGYLNIGGSHWIVCETCKTTWCCGYNLFSDWKDETQETWDENAKLLSGFREVKPIPEAKEFQAFQKEKVSYPTADCDHPFC